MSYAALLALCRALSVETLTDEPMSRHTTFQIGGPADVFCRPRTPEDVEKLLTLCAEREIPLYVVGNGSNLLVADEGLRGVVLCTTAMDAVEADPEDGCTLVCSAGAQLMQVCLAAKRRGLAGLAFAYGIPGTMGGAVLMNAGAYGGELRDVLLDSTHVEAGAVQTLEAERLALSYRHSFYSGRKDCCILRARVRLTPDDPEAIGAEMRTLMQRRRDKQPLELPSAGSAFKRPAGGYASALIDQCGLRGFAVGGAAVSDKHTGFVVNRGGASCRDVLTLLREVRRIVQDTTGFRLEPEVRLLGVDAAAFGL